MNNSPLAGRRVMVVEDELLVAMMIEDVLNDHGCTVIGPFSNVADALAAASTQVLDAALLDVNLRGEKIFPVAELLSDRSVPFLLLTGYGNDAVPADRPEWRACCKPFDPDELLRILTEMISVAELNGSHPI